MDEVKDKKIALIGGAGFIGHNLALELVKLGAKVTIFDAFSVNNLLNQIQKQDLEQNDELYGLFLRERLSLLSEAGIRIEVADFSDRFASAKALDEDFDIAYNLAAVSHASRSNKQPDYALSNSLIPFVNVINELANRKTRLVFLSSSTVYGNFEKDKVDEGDRCNPFGIYATLKYCSEMILREMGTNIDFNYSVVRPSALYGERCISRRVSQIFLENAVAGVENNFYGDADETLDFTYIKDLVQGLILAGVKEEARGEVFNITFGNARKVLTLVDILREYFPEVQVNVKDRNQATPIRGTLSNKKAKDLLGFSPAFKLEDGYKHYIEWYVEFVSKNNLKLIERPQINE